ncbi:MAG: hypothetical protein HYZ57_12950 [Acidobacteria bacterium]|nr:hypothetical protein [Acidobacteriota bacterium]MBI3280738.1 hypothetical protein [Acidobacteriota bacterium]
MITRQVCSQLPAGQVAPGGRGLQLAMDFDDVGFRGGIQPMAQQLIQL